MDLIMLLLLIEQTRVSSRTLEPDSIGMENTDIDMVLDTPDRAARRASINREVRKRARSPEAPVRFPREEHRHYLNGRARPVFEVGDNCEASDTQTENGHRSRASGSNALFRRTAAEKDKGKSICLDPWPARVEKNPVVNLNQRNGLTAPRCLPSEGVRESRTSNGSSPNKGKGKVDCGSVSNRETIDLSSEKKPNRSIRRLVRHGCISPHGITARARQATDGIHAKNTVSVEQEIAPETASSVGIRDIVSENQARGKRPKIFPSRGASRDGSEGWVSTRSRKLNIDHEMNRRDESGTRGICSSISTLDVQKTGEVDREVRHQRRRKNGSTSRASNEPEVSVIGSSGEPSSSRPPRLQNHQRQGIQVVEIEDSSPEVRTFRGPRRVQNDESDVKARQIEADELLARELQEQLYQESTLMRNEQIDGNIARLIQQ